MNLEIAGNAKVGGFIVKPGATTIVNGCSAEGRINAEKVTQNSSCIGGFVGNYGWNYSNIAKHTHQFGDCSSDVDIITGGAAPGGFLGSGTTEETSISTAKFIACTVEGTIRGVGTIGTFASEAECGVFVNCTDSTADKPFVGAVLGSAVLTGSNGTYTIE